MLRLRIRYGVCAFVGSRRNNSITRRTRVLKQSARKAKTSPRRAPTVIARSINHAYIISVRPGETTTIKTFRSRNIPQVLCRIYYSVSPFHFCRKGYYYCAEAKFLLVAQIANCYFYLNDSFFLFTLFKSSNIQIEAGISNFNKNNNE